MALSKINAPASGAVREREWWAQGTVTGRATTRVVPNYFHKKGNYLLLLHTFDYVKFLVHENIYKITNAKRSTLRYMFILTLHTTF